MRDDQERLQDILEAIVQIEKYAAGGREAFDRDELVQTWMVHHLQLIGEASRRVSEALRARRPEVPWPQIIAMRNILVREYFRVDADEVWAAVEREIPGLKRKIKGILTELGGST